MRTSFFLAGILSTGIALTAACGGKVVLDGTGGASTTSSNTGGAGGGLAPGQCRNMSDCKPPKYLCLQPGAIECGGPCNPMPATCTTDADCPQDGGTPGICTVATCSCPHGILTCTSGCTTDASCGPGETCGPTHRCAPQTCASTTDCPVNFTCSASTCQRTACTADAMCNGDCVTGLCFDTPGTCMEPLF